MQTARAGLKIAVVERNARIGGGLHDGRARPARLSFQSSFQFLHGTPLIFANVWSSRCR
jgi:phytoene dehydrogenase-like protein